VPKTAAPPAPRPLTPKELFRRKCEALGLTDAAQVEALWPAEKAKQDKARERGRRRAKTCPTRAKPRRSP